MSDILVLEKRLEGVTDPKSKVDLLNQLAFEIRLLKQDIAAREQAEVALIAAKEDAEVARRRAEDASREKTTFLTHMSHELRTPLSSILGFAQLLQMDDNLTGEQIESVDTILSSGHHLLALLNEILDLSKIEAGKLELQLEPCTVHHVIDAAVNLVQIQAQAKGLSLNVDVSFIQPNLFMIDETRLSQLLVNLLYNAIKFTDKGEISLSASPISEKVIAQDEDTEVPTTKVTIRDPSAEPVEDRLSLRQAQGAAERLPAKFRFQVSDSGVGMSQDELARIFRPFEQVGNTFSRAQGMGLGLTIAQKLVDLMGGTLQVESELGAGSLFWFDLEFDVVDSAKVKITN